MKSIILILTTILLSSCGNNVSTQIKNNKVNFTIKLNNGQTVHSASYTDIISIDKNLNGNIDYKNISIEEGNSATQPQIVSGYMIFKKDDYIEINVKVKYHENHIPTDYRGNGKYKL